jgi:hypothetical protein
MQLKHLFLTDTDNSLKHTSQVMITVPKTALKVSADPKTELDTVKVEVPSTAVPGEKIRFKLPDGRLVNAVVPENMRGGGTLSVQVPRAAMFNSLPQTDGTENGDDTDIEAPPVGGSLFNEDEYPNGDVDVIQASLKTGLAFDELVQVVWRKNDTIFRCDMAIIGPALFQFMDKDCSGGITPAEVLNAMNDPAILAYVKSIKCPILNKLFAEKEKSMMSSFKVCVGIVALFGFGS